MMKTPKQFNNITEHIYRIQQLLGKNPLEVGRILYALVDKVMLVSNNRGRWTSYSINSDYSQGVTTRAQKKLQIREALIAFCRKNAPTQKYITKTNKNNM
ncbi:hypothetical protein [Phocaeicola sp.]